MKKEFNAEVIGHARFRDPKQPALRAIKVMLEVSSMTPAIDKPSRAALVIEESDLAEFPMGRFLRITVQDSQQRMDFAGARGEKPNGKQLALAPPPAGKARKRAPATGESDAPH
jgi:hypothetical protein